MLCPACRRQLERGASWCGSCGAPIGGAGAPLDLVVDGQRRVPLVTAVTLGRAPDSTVVLSDPAVSRLHARIAPGNGEGPVLEDAGSRYGTYVDGVRVTGPVALRDGTRIRVGDSELAVERQRGEWEAGRTLVVPASVSVELPAVENATQYGMYPRVRSGYALRRRGASEGDRRWVLRDLESNTFLQLGDDDVELFHLLDGTRSLADLSAYADERFGAIGRARMVRLISDLGNRGFLKGVEGAPAAEEQPQSLIRRLLRPRVKVIDGLGPAFDTAYRRSGWVLFSRPALVALAAVAVTGLGVFVYLIAKRYGTPFVVASHVGIGGLVFLLGRLAVVCLHELAHGLTMASFGRRVERAGIRIVFIFPYAFVDTSEAWFEPRRRRIAVSAAGPVADFTLGAVFAICALALSDSVRDVFFQLAFAAYVGACFNLNPFLDRDGYHILVDVLREPGLRRRAREQFSRRLSGRPSEGDSPVLARYSLYGVAWSVVAALFAVGMSFRYREKIELVAQGREWLVWLVMGAVWIAVFMPVVILVGRPLVDRWRRDD